ncbi:PP2C family protein-serine/threonine phosphatase [Aestuariispira ectoiniformans]|uniref:PP2C family protein-serine/threonine phosphatase n=1 Tax=Aestuariispira ectoiniformans TaxID=2775080 RepID=UPI00223B9529|nr:fused response regulator/phosphatase [Aestuariispira ectoiniformans]
MKRIDGSLGDVASFPFSEIADAPILVADDSQILRELIKSFLSREGFNNIHVAEDGAKAIAMLEEIQPDIVILDILMPEMDGFEVCRTIRQNPKFAHIPILVETALEDSAERLEVFEVGATDLVLKPLNGQELAARVKVHLQNVHMARSQRRYHERMVRELDAARKVQESLLPSERAMQEAADQCDIRVAAYYESSSELGGDFWGLKPLGGGRLGLYTADFSGHGVAPALNTIRLHTLLMGTGIDWYNPELWMMATNTHLYRMTQTDQFATAFYGLLEPTKEQLVYVSAGCPRVIIGKVGGEATFHETSGLPAGIRSQAEHARRVAPFSSGSFIFLYSDALLETPGPDGAMMSEDELLSVVSEAASHNDPQRVIDTVRRAMPKVPGRGLLDDLTLVMLIKD